MQWAEVTADLYSFPLSSFGRVLGSPTSPIAISAPFSTPRTAELAALWHRFAALVVGQVLDQPQLYERDVIRAQMIDSLTAITVEAFAMTNGREEGTRDDDVVRRAEAFMRSRLSEPITIPDVASAAGISVRGLQLVYQRRFETTPVSRLRRLRLEQSRTALLNAAPGATVGAVGRRFGYSNLGRFSAHYRSEFDETPSQTLDRSHGPLHEELGDD